MSIESEPDRPSRLLPQTIEDILRAWTVRAAGAALALASLIVSLAMLTWSANDPSISLDTSEPAQNLLGPSGAMIADFFFHTLGLSVVFFVVPPLVLGLQLALGDTIKDLRHRLIVIAGSTIAIAGGLSALPLTDKWQYELGYGGIIGDFSHSIVGGILDQVVPNTGGTIAGLAFFAVGFWLFSRAICLDQFGVFAINHRQTATAAATPEHGRTRQSPFSFGRKSGASASAATANTARADAYAASQAEPQWGAPPEPPEPPSWSLDSRMSDYNQDAAPHIVTAPTNMAPVDEPSHPAVVTEPEMAALAGRFAPDNPAAALAAAERTNATVLIHEDADDDDAADLPNVLKRARDEANELMSRTQPAANSAPAEPILKMPRLPGFPKRPAVERADQQPGMPPPELSEQPPVPAAHPETAPRVVATGYRRPSLNLLRAQKPARPSADLDPSILQTRARMLQEVLGDFRIKGEVQNIKPGPVITLFELEPSRGTKSSRIVALADDVARSMSAISTRIAPVPGRNVIGIELPNTRRETFGLRELIDSPQFANSGAKLPIVLGKDIAGEPVLADLARMPHLLVAGTTGSGKSVGVNAMILSLIYRLGPQDCRLLLIDPKMLELSAYNGIPHLLSPVITDPQKAVTALTWAVSEMEERYKRMAELGVRSIDAFNTRAKHAQRTGEKLGRTVQTGFDSATGEAVFEETTIDAEPLPHIVIVVDEFADLMAVAGKEIEGLVQRLAQMARAAGIHLIMATQRPSVDVVTGTIKANFPTRISYRVASRIDSRTILGEQGGEQLLGQGDMLYLDATGQIQRVHGPFVSDEEVEAVTTSLSNAYPAHYSDDVLAAHEADPTVAHAPAGKPNDLYEEAVAIVQRDQKASTSYLQRRLGIGYNRAADLIDRMEEQGVIGTADHAGRRDILLAS